MTNPTAPAPLTERSAYTWAEVELVAKRDPHVRLLLAAHRGRGLRLSAKEVERLVFVDDAIASAALSLFDENRRLPWHKK